MHILPCSNSVEPGQLKLSKELANFKTILKYTLEYFLHFHFIRHKMLINAKITETTI